MTNDEHSKITGLEPQIGSSNNTGRPQMGEWIDAIAYMKKTAAGTSRLVVDSRRPSSLTSWDKVNEPVRGMYIGYRTVHEGRMTYE